MQYYLCIKLLFLRKLHQIMFTGIIEEQGRLVQLKREGSNINFQIESNISPELKVDQSLSHNGVCLTVIEIEKQTHWVTAIDETLAKTNLGQLKVGDRINLERAMLNNGRFDGHIVQGHVDQVGKIISIKEAEGSWMISIEYLPVGGHVMVEKGSITIDGISLTCFDIKENGFSVAIIPYTYENTNIGTRKVGDLVNLEFDILGKYVQRLLALK